MRNLRLLATILFVAVLLVGIVLLLRQTNVQNDTSVTSTQTTSQQLADATSQTDPPAKKIKKGVTIINKNASTQQSFNKKNIVSKQDLKKVAPSNVQLDRTPTSVQELRAKRGLAPATTNNNKTMWNPKASKADQIHALEEMLRQESNPKVKAKIQHKLNSLK